MSRTARVLASTSLGYLQLTLTTVVNLWWTPFLLRHFSQHDYGLWVAGLPMLTYVSLVDFGVVTVLQRDVAYALGSAGGSAMNAHDLSGLVGRTLRLVLMQLPAASAAALVAWLAIATRPDWRAFCIPFAIVLSALVTSFPLRVSHAVLMGLQDLSFVARMALFNWAISVGGGVVLVVLGWGLKGLAIAWAAAQLGTNVGYYARVKIRFPHALPRRLPHLARSEAAVRLRKGFWILLSQLAAMLLNGSDMIVIAAMLGPASVVPYAITDKLISLLGNVPQQVMTSAQPALSELRASSERARLAEICVALTQAVLILSGFIAILVVAVDRGFVNWWVGAQQFAGAKVVVLLAAGMVINQWWITTISMIFSFGYERHISLTTIANGIVTLAVSIPATRFFGIMGAPAAAIVGLIAVALPFNLLVIARETGRPTKANLALLLPWTWRFIVLAIGFALLSRLWIPASILKLLVTGTTVGLVYWSIMLPLLFREPLGTYTRPRMAALRLRFVGERA